jgi:hypothetical protein
MDDRAARVLVLCLVLVAVFLCLCTCVCVVARRRQTRKYRNERRMMQIAREVVREELERHREGRKGGKR